MKKMVISESKVQEKIYNIRGVQVMLDSDLAELYEVSTKRLNEQVKRNIERFPDEFMFRMTANELQSLRSQFATLKTGRGTHRKYLAYAFTEQGVAMLSSVLSSKTAIKVNIQIIKTFVNIRKAIFSNTLILDRVNSIEQKQLKTDVKVDSILNAIENKNIQIKPKIFFNGKVFDAHVLLSKLIKKAKKDIVLIDNYIDESILALLTKRKKICRATIYTQSMSKALKLDLEKHNQQHPEIKMQIFKKSHDRFLILDKKEVYLIGTSLKDLGKKISTISKLEMPAGPILKTLKQLSSR